MLLSTKEKRIKRVRAKIFGTEQRPRLAIKRSNRQIFAQLINDEKGTTVASASSLKIKEKIKPLEKAAKVGEMIAQAAQDIKITTAVFDRRDKKYHGQIKALAEAARAKGLRI